MLKAIEFTYQPNDFKIEETKFRDGRIQYTLLVRVYRTKFGLISSEVHPTDEFERFECYLPGLQCTGEFLSMEDVQKWIDVLLIPYYSQKVNSEIKPWLQYA